MTEKSSDPRSKRLPRRIWMRIEEEYRNGATQAELSKKYKIRVETVSRHMTKRAINPMENEERVREEIKNSLLRKQRIFAEMRDQREIETKDTLFKLNQLLVMSFAKEFKATQDGSKPIALLQQSARALKDAVQALRVSREEMYKIIGVQENGDGGEREKLVVESMTPEEEAAHRQKRSVFDDDDEVEMTKTLDALAEDLDEDEDGEDDDEPSEQSPPQ